MVVTKTIQIKSAGSLSNAIRYITNPDKTTKRLVSTYGVVSVETAAKEFELSFLKAETSNKSVGRKKQVIAHHIIQSFSPEDGLSYDTIHGIGRQTVLELTGGEHEFVIATHIDQGHIHNHIIFNSTNLLTSKNFRWQKGTTRNLQMISDKHSEIHGAFIIERDKLFTFRKYTAYRKSNTFTSKIKRRLDFLLQHTVSMEDFLSKADLLELDIDFSKKEPSFRLKKGQERRIRSNTLNKKGRYSLEKIKERVTLNQKRLLSDEQFLELFGEQEKKIEEDFSIRVIVEKDQIQEVTYNGIYLSVDFGIRNHGLIKIPSSKIEFLENGDVELFLKPTDYFYFLNQDQAFKNRFIQSRTLANQLSRKSGQFVLNKNPHIQKLDQLIQNFEFLSKHEVTNEESFIQLKNKLVSELQATSDNLKVIGRRFVKLQKIESALLQPDDPTVKQLLKEYQVKDDIDLSFLQKEITEIQIEKTAIENALENLEQDLERYEVVNRQVQEQKQEKGFDLGL